MSFKETFWAILTKMTTKSIKKALGFSVTRTWGVPRAQTLVKPLVYGALWTFFCPGAGGTPPLFATSSTRGFLKQFLKGRLQKQIEKSVAAPHIHLESRKGKGSSSSLLVGHRQKVVQNTL